MALILLPCAEIISMSRKMTRDEWREFLTQGTRTGKLATVRRDGRPHAVPIWFVLDGDDLLFTTGAGSVKVRAMRRDPRVCLCVDDERPPYAFVMVEGQASLSDDLDAMLRVATAIGGRYMGADRAEEFGRRNAVPGELLVRVRPTRVLAAFDIAG
jgi:PPOX class probable F420-dependent enzyme